MGGVALPSCKLLGLRPPSPGVYGPYGLYGLYDRVNGELLDVQAGFWKGRRTGDQIANIHSIIEKAREFHKNIYFSFIDYIKAFDCVDHNKLENS